MGVIPGDPVLLTADVTRLSWLMRRQGARQAPRALLDAFLAHLGPQGTLVVPTFNHDLRPGDAFDRRNTPTITGVLGQAALEHPAFIRTAHPLHSFAVAGALTSDFLGANDDSSFGARSPFALFRTHRFTLIGIDMHLNQAMSYFHHVEEQQTVPYRHWRSFPIRYTDRDGATRERTFRLYAKRKGYANELSALIPLLQGPGAQVDGRVDGVPYLRVDLGAAHEVIERDIRSNRARSIVRFTWRNWLRDLWQGLRPPPSPTRTEQLIRDRDARTR